VDTHSTSSRTAASSRTPRGSVANARDDLMGRISDSLRGRPVRWAQDVVGDYEGRDRTLEVFNADPAE